MLLLLSSPGPKGEGAYQVYHLEAPSPSEDSLYRS